jgi:serine/threonine protein kinase
MKDICFGYNEIIKHNIIHRDLKPANIFKKNNIWKIGDFGFSLIIDNSI